MGKLGFFALECRAGRLQLRLSHGQGVGSARSGIRPLSRKARIFVAGNRRGLLGFEQGHPGGGECRFRLAHTVQVVGLVNAKHDLSRRDTSATAKSGVHPNDASANLRGEIDLRGGPHDSGAAHGDGAGACGDAYGFDERYSRRRLAALRFRCEGYQENGESDGPGDYCRGYQKSGTPRITDDTPTGLHV